jgi:hypothetical protein
VCVCVCVCVSEVTVINSYVVLLLLTTLTSPGRGIIKS